MDTEVVPLLDLEITRMKAEACGTAITKKKELGAGKNRSDEVAEEIFAEEIFIENAGQVLVAVYLPRLFNMLGLLGKYQFRDEAGITCALAISGEGFVP